MYDAQGSLVCHEKYQNYDPLYEEFNPIVSLLSPSPSPVFTSPAVAKKGLAGKCGPRNESQKCQADLFCINGTCETPAKAYTFLASSKQNDPSIRDCKDFSGPEIKDCTIPESLVNGKCGPQGSGKLFRCYPGQYCTNNGNCVYAKPQQRTQNCDRYSGQGIKNCAREISSKESCFDQDGYKSCPTNKFCLPSGQCVNEQPTSQQSSDACLYFSGSGITNCSRPSTTPRNTTARTLSASTSVTPKLLQTQKDKNINAVKSGKTKWTVNAANAQQCNSMCSGASTGAQTCNAFSYYNNVCTHTDARRSDVIGGGVSQTGATFGYRA